MFARIVFFFLSIITCGDILINRIGQPQDVFAQWALLSVCDHRLRVGSVAPRGGLVRNRQIGITHNIGYRRPSRAWIETPGAAEGPNGCSSPLHVGVDRNTAQALALLPRGGRPLKGGVDRNVFGRLLSVWQEMGGQHPVQFG